MIDGDHWTREITGAGDFAALLRTPTSPQAALSVSRSPDILLIVDKYRYTMAPTSPPAPPTSDIPTNANANNVNVTTSTTLSWTSTPPAVLAHALLSKKSPPKVPQRTADAATTNARSVRRKLERVFRSRRWVFLYCAGRIFCPLAGFSLDSWSRRTRRPREIPFRGRPPRGVPFPAAASLSRPLRCGVVPILPVTRQGWMCLRL